MDFTYWDYIRNNGYPYQRNSYLNKKPFALALLIYVSTLVLWCLVCCLFVGLMFTVFTLPFLLVSTNVSDNPWVFLYYPIIGLVFATVHIWKIRS